MSKFTDALNRQRLEHRLSDLEERFEASSPNAVGMCDLLCDLERSSTDGAGTDTDEEDPERWDGMS